MVQRFAELVRQEITIVVLELAVGSVVAVAGLLIVLRGDVLLRGGLVLMLCGHVIPPANFVLKLLVANRAEHHYLTDLRFFRFL